MEKIIKNKKQKNMKSMSGITLISLVITIIVLLILVGIAIVSLTGDNSILKLAAESKEKTENVTQYEEDKLELMEFLLKEQSGEIEVPANAVARIGTTYYTTLQAAIDEVPNDNTRTMVVLIKDVSEYITISGTKNVALYLNGNTVSPDTNVSNEDGNETIIVTNGAKLMVADGKVTATGENGAIGNYEGCTLQITDGAELISEDAKYGTVYNEGSLSVEGGIIKGDYEAICNDSYENDSGRIIAGEATISGGEISSSYWGVVNSSKLTVSGGKIKGTEMGLYNHKGESIILGGEISSSKYGVNNWGVLNVIDGTISGEKYAIANQVYGRTYTDDLKAGEITISGGKITSNNGGGIANVGILSIKGGKIEVGEAYGIYNISYEEKYGAIITGETTISAGEIISDDYGIYNYGKLNVTGGTITGTNYAIYNTSKELDYGTTKTGEATVSTDKVTINGNTNL